MADQDYPNLYADMEASAQRTRAAAISFEGVLGGTETDMIPVNGYPNQPTIAGRFKARMDQLQAPIDAAIEASKRYLGSSATAPTTRADGSPLQKADSYFNSTENAEYIWNGTGWYKPNADGQAIQQAFAGPEGVTLVGNAVDVRKLADTSDPLLGAGMVGRGSQVVNTIAELKALKKTAASKHVFVLGYYAAGDGGGGQYFRDAADTTSPGDNGTIVRANDDGRWKLVFSHNNLNMAQMGARPGVDCSAQLLAGQQAIYSKYGAGVLNFHGVLRFDVPCPNYPGVIIRGSGQQSSALEYYGPGNTIALWTTRPDGYVPTIAVAPGLENTSYIRRNGTIYDNTIGLDINLCKFGSFRGLYMALWDRAVTHNATNSKRGTLPFDYSQQDFWNVLEQIEFNTCRFGQTYYGAANRNDSRVITYSNCEVCHDFSNANNSAETNTYTQENYEGCKEWALWKAGAEAFIYTQTWIGCVVENPTYNNFICYMRDPGHQVFINMSIIPPNAPNAVSLVEMFPGVTSFWLGTGTADRYTDFGFRIPEVMKIYKVPQLGPKVAKSAVFAGTIAAGAFETLNIPFPGAKLNDLANATALRTLNGCSINQAFAVADSVTVIIGNSTASSKTISSVEIVATLNRTT